MGKCHRVLSASISYTGRTSNPFAFTARCYSWKISLPARNDQRGEHAQLKFLISLKGSIKHTHYSHQQLCMETVRFIVLSVLVFLCLLLKDNFKLYCEGS